MRSCRSPGSLAKASAAPLLRREVRRLPAHRGEDARASARMVEEDPLLERTGVKLAVFAQEQIGFGFAIRLPGGVQAVHVSLELLRAREGVFYRREQQPNRGNQQHRQRQYGD